MGKKEAAEPILWDVPAAYMWMCRSVKARWLQSTSEVVEAGFQLPPFPASIFSLRIHVVTLWSMRCLKARLKVL